jgi:hypothetical protein
VTFTQFLLFVALPFLLGWVVGDIRKMFKENK